MIDPDAPVATAARAIAGALLRHAIGWAGAWLIARGYVDQHTADRATGPIADYLLGAGLAIGAACWAAFRARLTHWRWVRALYAPAIPDPASDPAPVATTKESTVKIFGLTITTSSIVATGESILTKAVTAAAAAGNPIGDAAITAAKNAEAAGGTGASKKAAVIAAIIPVIAQEALKGGVTELEADAETFAGMVVEEVVSLMKSTPLGILAAAVLHVFGVNLKTASAGTLDLSKVAGAHV